MESHSLQVPRLMRSKSKPLSAMLGWVAFGLLLLKFTCYGHAQSPADLVVLNANVVTCDDQLRRVEAVAIQNGRFIAVGSNATCVKGWGRRLPSSMPLAKRLPRD